MRPKHEITDADKSLFRKAVKAVKPLSHTKSIHRPTIPSPPSRPIHQAPESHLGFSNHTNLPSVKSHDFIQFARSGIQHKTLRKLKAGQYNVEAFLDLHGKTVTQAEQALRAFLLQCQRKQIRYALIVHGKGRKTEEPILKNKLNHWLRECEEVLAFCTAGAKDGRFGALYVLLKKLKGGT